MDLERDRAGLRIGERLRLRARGDLLGGLRARLGGELNGKKKENFSCKTQSIATKTYVKSPLTTKCTRFTSASPRTSYNSTIDL